MTYEQAIYPLPDGFHFLVKSAFDMLELIKSGDVGNEKAEIVNAYEFSGSLIVMAENIGNPIHKVLWGRVVYSIRGQSMRTCRICGIKGRRRRYFRERYALCFQHFLQEVDKFERIFYKDYVVSPEKMIKINKFKHFKAIGKELEELNKLIT